MVGSPGPLLQGFATRLSIKAGDFIGVDAFDTTTFVGFRQAAGAAVNLWHPTPLPEDGSPSSPNSVSNSGELLLNADIEPDADADGFGDESQDQCPTDPATQTECDPPETRITKGAPNKTKKHKVKFKFKSSEPGSSFECKLDKKPFKPCKSPRKYKRLKKGKHKFKVRATDAAGNTDSSPAKDKFKVVR